MKNCNNTIGNRTLDHQAYNAAPQPAACSATGLVKRKFHFTAAHEDPNREQTYSPSLNFNSALDGDGWSTPRPDRFNP